MACTLWSYVVRASCLSDAYPASRCALECRAPPGNNFLLEIIYMLKVGLWSFIMYSCPSLTNVPIPSTDREVHRLDRCLSVSRHC
jgi:hypothetical protein